MEEGWDELRDWNWHIYITTYKMVLPRWLSGKRTCLPMYRAQEMWVWSLGREDPLEEEMATHSSILDWEKPMDRGGWWATVHGVAKSRTQLSTHTYMVKDVSIWRGHSAQMFGPTLFWMFLCGCLGVKLHWNQWTLSRANHPHHNVGGPHPIGQRWKTDLPSSKGEPCQWIAFRFHLQDELFWVFQIACLWTWTVILSGHLYHILNSPSLLDHVHQFLILSLFLSIYTHPVDSVFPRNPD